MFETLFEPIRIGTLELNNRLVVPPMVTNFCTDDGHASERFIRHMEDKARGGWGLITIEQSVVSQEGKGHPNQPCLMDDACLESLSELTRRVHEAGGKIGVQINHAGRSSNCSITGMPLVAPSALRDPVRRDIPQELTVEHIKEIIEQFGEAALRAKKAGFDSITEHAHARYLIPTFLSPTANKRTDEYGGSLFNRARFAVEILRKMKEKVGQDFPILVRLSASECVEGGLSVMDTLAVAQLLEMAGADAIDVSVGNAFSPYYITAPSIVDHGFVANISEQFKKAVSVPVAVAGRINDPCIAETILKTGKADLISMGRASIADPDLPRKLRDGRADDIRYCIGCIQGCVGGVRQLKPITCLVNPRIGREERDADTISGKKIAVIGGGVAGMQASITLAESGNTVTLFEKEDKLGGQWLLAAVPPGKTEFTTLVYWQKKRLRELKVDIHLNTPIEANDPQLKAFDKVVLSTGGIPIMPRIPGVDLPFVVQAADVLSGRKDTGKTVAVIGGGLVGSETALHLAMLGMDVSIIEMADSIAAALEPSTKHFLVDLFKKKDVKIYTGSKVTEFRDGVVVIERNGRNEELTGLDTVVLALGSRPNNRILEELKENGIEPLAIGDVVKVRKGIDAVAEGYCSAWEMK